MSEERKSINKMTKRELKFELDNLRIECDRMKLMQEITTMVSRMVTTMDLEKVKKCVERIYKETVVANWGFYYGVRDNIHDMADNLAEMQNVEELQYLNTFMYALLLDMAPKATEGLYTMTDGMTRVLLEHETKGGSIV